jgi:hypothetical protein
MALIVELKITNLRDWAIIQPLLQRLKIHFVQKTIQKDNEQNLSIIETQKEDDALLTLQKQSPAIVWSAYDSPKAAETLMQLLENSNQ